MFKISVDRDPKPNYIFQRSWFNSRLNGPISTLSFQNPQILQTISSGQDVINTPASFPVWEFIMTNGTIYQPLRSGRIWHKVNF